jgi:hypothetical protein
LQLSESDPEDEWIEAFRIFRITNDDQFPLYMTRTLEKEIHRSIELERGEPAPTVRQTGRLTTTAKPGDEFKRPDWTFPLAIIETIDIEAAVDGYRNCFSLENLATAIIEEKRSKS